MDRNGLRIMGQTDRYGMDGTQFMLPDMGPAANKILCLYGGTHTLMYFKPASELNMNLGKITNVQTVTTEEIEPGNAPHVKYNGDIDMDDHDLTNVANVGVNKIKFQMGAELYVDNWGMLCYKNPVAGIIHPIAGQNKMFTSDSTTKLFEDDYVVIQWFVDGVKSQPQMKRKTDTQSQQDLWYDVAITFSHGQESGGNIVKHSHDDIRFLDHNSFYWLTSEGNYDAEFNCKDSEGPDDEYASRYYVGINKEQATAAPGYIFNILIGKLGEWALFEMQQINTNPNV